ncbi:MAG: phosphotransferase [Mizugakiibacter sp.]|uniref:aminoglycoside phosphotransferase family protein n=1 Tax=Mizugakiibacter sp. TaxID=1972610 RepID=UPI0031C6F8CF|nr:phosphotransferase [Xanthomonadaceae bacterium]
MHAPNPDRAAARLAWARSAAGDPAATLVRASDDASFRSYWRLASGARTLIVMDAPPDKEDVRPWLDIARRLRAAGVHAPAVHAEDAARGFLLLEDLGTRTYLPELNAGTVDALYADALDALLRMQTRVEVAGLPPYDANRLIAEMELLPTWFLQRHLGFTPACEQWDTIELAFRRLADSALAQPRAFVHRDYHSRNLLIVADDNPGVIDFQDGVVGAVTYDLVSLLRDCYIVWDDARVEAWCEGYRERLRHAGLIGAAVDAARFRRWFDLMGLQRHLKVLGIFCRLWYRDGKPGYLGDLPRVWHYVRSVAARYPEFADLAALLERAIGERDLTRPRDEAAVAAASR